MILLSLFPTTACADSLLFGVMSNLFYSRKAGFRRSSSIVFIVVSLRFLSYLSLFKMGELSITSCFLEQRLTCTLSTSKDGFGIPTTVFCWPLFWSFFRLLRSKLSKMLPSSYVFFPVIKLPLELICSICLFKPD